MLPPPALAHRRHRRLAAIPDALDVDRHRGVPIRLGDGVEAAAVQRAVERGIVDQRVEPAERLDRRIGHRERRKSGSLTSSVTPIALPPCACCEGERRRAVVDVGGDDMRAGRREAAREFLPEAARRAGDERRPCREHP